MRYSASLSFAHLDSASLKGAILDSADLSAASLKRADLGEASMVGVKLTDADLGETDLRGANLRDVEGWRAVRTLKLANIHGVRNPPPGFVSWAVDTMGAIQAPNKDHLLPRYLGITGGPARGLEGDKIQFQQADDGDQ